MATGAINLPEGYSLDQPGLPEGYTLDPQTSVTGALGRGALDAIPFGTKGAAAVGSTVSGGSYDKTLAELDSLIEADRQQHPVAHTIGEIGGSVAPLAIPGVGEALGAESALGRAGIGAGIGALQGASNTRADLTSSQGLSDIAKGAGLGAVVNPAAGAVGDVISSALGKTAPELEQFANKKVVQSAGIRPGVLGLPEDELNDLGKQMTDWGLDQGSLQERVQKANLLKTVIGSKIGDIGAGSLPLENAAPFVDNLSKEAEQSSKFFGTEGNQDLNMYRQGIANIQNNGKDFQSLQALKSAYGEKAFDANGQISNPAAAKVYGQIKEAMKSIVDSSPKVYQDAMDKYGSILDIQSGLTKQLQQEQATGSQARGFGMMGKMVGMLGKNPAVNVGAAALLAPAHPFMAAGALTPLVTNPQAMAGAARSLAGAATGAAGAIRQATPAITNMATNQPTTSPIPPQYNRVFQKATQGIQDPAQVQKAMTITDFVLQSRDPNYVKAKQNLSEQQ